MRLHLLEHELDEPTHTNIIIWAEEKGYEITRTYVCNMEELPSIHDLDWLVVMGGAPHAWEEEKNPWLPSERRFISEALESGKIILGLCLGAQVLADVLGGQVFPTEQEEIGWHPVSLTPEGKGSFLFKNVPKTFVTYHWHSDQFSLPPGCTNLAVSDPTPTQAFISEGRPAVGLQFHPEFTKEMVRYFCDECGDGWEPGPFVAGKEATLAETERMPDTYWLMETLLDNMDREFRDALN